MVHTNIFLIYAKTCGRFRKTRGVESACRSIVIDVTDTYSLEDKIKEASTYFDKPMSILVNSAGKITSKGLLDMEEADWNNVFDANAKGTYFMSQKFAKYMIENNIKGHILNVSSSSSLRPGWSPYQISKWTVTGITKGLADTLLPYGIVVNAIAPGPVATPMLGKSDYSNIYNAVTPAGRYAMPQEIAELAAFMVSDKGNLIVGDTFYITGGSGVISLHK